MTEFVLTARSSGPQSTAGERFRSILGSASVCLALFLSGCCLALPNVKVDVLRKEEVETRKDGTTVRRTATDLAALGKLGVLFATYITQSFWPSVIDSGSEITKAGAKLIELPATVADNMTTQPQNAVRER